MTYVEALIDIEDVCRAPRCRGDITEITHML